MMEAEEGSPEERQKSKKVSLLMYLFMFISRLSILVRQRSGTGWPVWLQNNVDCNFEVAF